MHGPLNVKLVFLLWNAKFRSNSRHVSVDVHSLKASWERDFQDQF